MISRKSYKGPAVQAAAAATGRSGGTRGARATFAARALLLLPVGSHRLLPGERRRTTRTFGKRAMLLSLLSRRAARLALLAALMAPLALTVTACGDEVEEGEAGGEVEVDD